METRSDFSFCELIDLSSSIHEFPAQFSSIPVSVVSLQPGLGSANTVHISPLLGAQKCNCSCCFFTLRRPMFLKGLLHFLRYEPGQSIEDAP